MLPAILNPANTTSGVVASPTATHAATAAPRDRLTRNRADAQSTSVATNAATINAQSGIAMVCSDGVRVPKLLFDLRNPPRAWTTVKPPGEGGPAGRSQCDYRWIAPPGSAGESCGIAGSRDPVVVPGQLCEPMDWTNSRRREPRCHAVSSTFSIWSAGFQGSHNVGKISSETNPLAR